MAADEDGERAPFGRLVDARREHSGEAMGIPDRAVELVRSMDPIRLSLGRKQRLLLSLGRGAVRPRTPWLRAVVVGVVLLGSGAMASAALTSWPTRFIRSLETLVSRSADSRSLVRPPAEHPGPMVEPTAPPKSAPTPTMLPPVVHRVPSEARSRRPPVEPPSDDPSLLVQATHALQVDRDPELARGLASRYLEREPRGALADEALAISIEAAVDHHDADAAALSSRYLAQFPRGSFRALAERTLAPSQHR